MPWTHRDGTSDRETTDEIDRQEDRAAAIIAAAFLEDRITDAVKARLIRDAQVSDQMFKGVGPLANFSAKADIAYLLGFFSHDQLQAAHIIRKIRNEFAHNLAPLTFKSQIIQDMCKNFSKYDIAAPTRGIMVTTLINTQRMDALPYIEQWFSALDKPQDTSARIIYMSVTQLISFHVTIQNANSRFLTSLFSPWRHIPGLLRPPAPQNGSQTRSTRARRQRPSRK